MSARIERLMLELAAAVREEMASVPEAVGTLGEEIARARQHARLSLQEVADRSGFWYTLGRPARCVEGRLYRHDPQWDDPDLETDVGPCPDCCGYGCDDEGASRLAAHEEGAARDE